MEQTASKTEPDSLEDKESIYESPPELTGFSPQDADYYPPGAEDPVIDGKPVEHSGNVRSKKYSKITDEQRRDFINAVENDGEKIINAAKRFDINYSSAKSILNVFKSEGRSIKKQFRDKLNKNQKYFQEGGESSLVKNSASGEKLAVGDKISTTNNASTQTMSDPDEEENSLLALRDRLLASKTDKRQNPYEGLSSHELTRFSGSLNDYSESQLAFDPNSGNRSGGGQVFNLVGNSNQTFMSQQNISRPDSMGYGSNYQLFQQGTGVGGPNMMQNSPSMYQQQQQQPQYLPSYQGGQARSGPDFSKGSNFEGPPRQQEGQSFGSMIYTGVNPVQYFMMNPTNDQMRGMQIGQGQQQQPQYQFLQPIMYVMPTTPNIPNMNQPYIIPQQNNPIIYNQSQNNDSGQNQKGGGPNYNNNPYSNMK